jgi:Beta-lactamase class C and other penicillin binding proteins
MKRKMRRIPFGFKALILIILFVPLLVFAILHSGFIKPKAIPVQSGPPVNETAVKIDEYMLSHVNYGYFSGSVLIAKNGSIILQKGYGMANYELNALNTSDTKYRIGSLTKQFTAMAIMQLQEKGFLNVSDNIIKYLPGFPNGDKITIHNLLTHTSGLTDYINDDKSFNEDSRLYSTPQKLVERFKNKPLLFKPGTKASYSNTGYLLLSLIIEKVSGKSYHDYLSENIFNPLNMKDTGWDKPEALIKNRAEGYGISDNKLVNAEYTDMSNFYGDGDLYSTINDLYTWDRALYTEKLVSKKTMDLIFKDYKSGYGYGWKVEDSGKNIYHVGRVNGFYSYIGRFPEQNSTVIILSNNWSIPLATIYKNVDAILQDQKYELPKYTKPVDAAMK